MQFSEYSGEKKNEDHRRKKWSWDDGKSTTKSLFANGKGDEDNPKTSLRARKTKGLSVKVGNDYDKEAAKNHYTASRKESKRIMNIHKPSKPKNPLHGTPRVDKSSPKNSLRMKNQKPITKKLGTGHSLQKAYECYKASREAGLKMLNRAKPQKPRNPLGDHVPGTEKASPKKHMKMGNKRLAGKVGTNVNLSAMRSSYEAATKERNRIQERAKPSKPGPGPLSSV